LNYYIKKSKKEKKNIYTLFTFSFPKNKVKFKEKWGETNAKKAKKI
jgi:hypothetical protein